jgi:hypothetical protein
MMLDHREEQTCGGVGPGYNEVYCRATHVLAAFIQDANLVSYELVCNSVLLGAAELSKDIVLNLQPAQCTGTCSTLLLEFWPSDLCSLYGTRQ